MPVALTCKLMQMNYKDIVDLAIADLDEFFDDKHSSKITAETTNRRLMSASGIDDGRKLLIEHYLANTEVDTLEDVLLCLILVGHEACHLMNNHNKQKDWAPSQRKALEAWADFYGARVTFTLITHGRRIQEVIATIQGPLASVNSLKNVFSQERLLIAFGNSLDSIYMQFSSAMPSKNYPSPSERLLIIMAGVSSFFYREFGEMNENWTFYLYSKIAFERSWFRQSSNDMTGKDFDYSLPVAINEIHKGIAGLSASISPGLRPEYEKLIGTGYKNTEKGRRRAAKAMALEFSKWKTEFGPEMQRVINSEY